MPLLLELLAAAIFYIGSWDVTISETPRYRTDIGEFSGQVYAQVSCDSGIPSMQIFAHPEYNEVYLVVHEALHGVACKHDGSILPYGSWLDPTGCTRAPMDCPHSWVYWAMENPTEARWLIEGLSR